MISRVIISQNNRIVVIGELNLVKSLWGFRKGIIEAFLLFIDGQVELGWQFQLPEFFLFTWKFPAHENRY